MSTFTAPSGAPVGADAAGNTYNTAMGAALAGEAQNGQPMASNSAQPGFAQGSTQLNHGQIPQDLSQHGVAQQSNGIGNGPQLKSTTDAVEIVCGPLLNYRHMSGQNTDNPVWHGSILIVTTPGQQPGQLRLSYVGAVGPNGAVAESQSNTQTREFTSVRLYEDPKKAFFRYEIDLPFQEQESTWEYTIPNMRPAPNATLKLDRPKRFSVPSKHESMRIMFHSCNGFSVGTDEEAWSGPAL